MAIDFQTLEGRLAVYEKTVPSEIDWEGMSTYVHFCDSLHKNPTNLDSTEKENLGSTLYTTLKTKILSKLELENSGNEDGKSFIDSYLQQITQINEEGAKNIFKENEVGESVKYIMGRFTEGSRKMAGPVVWSKVEKSDIPGIANEYKRVLHRNGVPDIVPGKVKEVQDVMTLHNILNGYMDIDKGLKPYRP